MFKDTFKKLGLAVPEIILPNKDIDLTKFATIAVDQFTENNEYWDSVKNFVGSSTSALNITLPENFYLRGDKDYAKRIETARTYLLNKEILFCGNFFVFIKRKLKGGTRCGLVAAFDLEQYDYNTGGANLIKVTEKTDLNRVVPRTKLREDIDLEIPHIFMLICDKQNKLMNYLNEASAQFERLYDFDLMKDGGNIKGYKVENKESFEKIATILEEIFIENGEKFSFAIGDGNHSFAAAKMHYENLKKSLGSIALNHPARYALAEIINLYDDSMEYEPIHRLLTNIEDKQKAISEISSILGVTCSSPEELSKIDLQILQPALDTWLEKNKNVHIEYVHDKKTCLESGTDPHSLALIFDKFDKDSLVKTVQENKVLVRKSFSMGHPYEKRYYLEARLIK